MREVYKATIKLGRFIMVDRDEVYPDGHVDHHGPVSKAFSTPVDLAVADSILAGWGYRKLGAWARTDEGRYWSHVEPI